VARTTPGLVRGVLGDDYEDGKDINPYIRAAGIMINQLVTVAAPTIIEDPVLAELETWVAAWAYCQSNQQAQSASNLGASASFRGNSGMFLENNNYGQMAIMLDPTGKLRTLQSGILFEAAWAGTPTGQQTNYWDRGNTGIR
jgi:hypothetical protein